MRKFIAAFLITAATGAIPAAAQPSPEPQLASENAAPNPATIAAVVETLAANLDENFVDPEVGRQYATALRANLSAGKYAAVADADAFAKAVTADLQAVHKDGHLRLFSPAMMEKIKAGPRTGEGKKPASFIEKSGQIAPGVAYISFLAFMGDEPTKKQLQEFLAAEAGAKVLIVDARHHHGGGLDEMDLMFAQLFANPTDLLALDTREAVAKREGASEFGDLPTLRLASAPATVIRQLHRAIPASKPSLANTKVLLLTSKKTASAGEHLALALKRTHRATLIGETSRGAGNYGRPFELAEGYQAFIPFGRTFDPDTGEGWEGTGVTPDVAVPAYQALDKALEMAGVKARSTEVLASLR